MHNRNELEAITAKITAKTPPEIPSRNLAKRNIIFESNLQSSMTLDSSPSPVAGESMRESGNKKKEMVTRPPAPLPSRRPASRSIAFKSNLESKLMKMEAKLNELNIENKKLRSQKQNIDPVDSKVPAEVEVQKEARGEVIHVCRSWWQ